MTTLALVNMIALAEVASRSRPRGDAGKGVGEALHASANGLTYRDFVLARRIEDALWRPAAGLAHGGHAEQAG